MHNSKSSLYRFGKKTVGLSNTAMPCLHCRMCSRLCWEKVYKIKSIYSHNETFHGTISYQTLNFCHILQLYGDFADTFELSECKLAIVHCAGHYDQQLVQALWQEIIERGKCLCLVSNNQPLDYPLKCC